MKKILCLICALLCAALLCACDLSDVVSGGLVGELGKQDPTDPFAKQPYYLMYTSNGDGTCYVSEIILDPNNSAEVEIPKQSPGGEKVVGVRVEMMPESVNDYFPQVITKASMEGWIEGLRDKDAISEFDIAKFTSHYKLMSTSEQTPEELAAECPVAQYADVYVFMGTTEFEYEYASTLFFSVLPLMLKERPAFDAEILELCKQHLTDEQTESMLKLMGCRNVRSLGEIQLHKDIAYVSIMQYKNNTVPVSVYVSADMTMEQWEAVDCAQTNLYVRCTDGELAPH